MEPGTMLDGRWALVLGASSGFGAAAARALARAGMNIFGVHLDPRRTLERAEAVIADIEAVGRRAVFFNTNAADVRRRERVVRSMREVLVQPSEAGAGSAGAVHMMVHTLAFGSLRPLIADDPDSAVNQSQMEMTLNVMAHSLVYWTQDLVRAGLLGRGSRVYAMSSLGSQRVSSTQIGIFSNKARPAMPTFAGMPGSSSGLGQGIEQNRARSLVPFASNRWMTHLLAVGTIC